MTTSPTETPTLDSTLTTTKISRTLIHDVDPLDADQKHGDQQDEDDEPPQQAPGEV